MIVRRIAALLMLGLLAAACSAGPGTGGQLEGTDWSSAHMPRTACW